VSSVHEDFDRCHLTVQSRDGTGDRERDGDLAARVGYTARQLEWLLQAEVGAGPLAIARARQTQTADPEAVTEVLDRDPGSGPLAARAPGQRIPRNVDAAEPTARLGLGQQRSTRTARTHAGGLAALVSGLTGGSVVFDAGCDWERTRRQLLALPGQRRTPAARNQRWRPWRPYATQHLWTALDHPVNRWPAQETA